MDHPHDNPPPEDAGDPQHELPRLRAALQAWEAFARSLPHELGAPLLLLEAYSTVLLDTEAQALSPRGRKYVERMRNAAAHLRSVGTAALLLAPMSTQAMRWQRVDLSSLAWQVIDVLRERDKARKVETSVEPGMSVTGDPDLLRALLGNLIGNAWKFSAPRAVARIVVQTVEAEHGRAVCVADDGVGFDMLQAGRLFTPFGRLHGLAEFEGSALGLWIARSVVERHSGRIWAESVEGEGARFYFALGASPQVLPPARS